MEMHKGSETLISLTNNAKLSFRKGVSMCTSPTSEDETNHSIVTNTVGLFVGSQIRLKFTSHLLVKKLILGMAGSYFRQCKKIYRYS